MSGRTSFEWATKVWKKAEKPAVHYSQRSINLQEDSGRTKANARRHQKRREPDRVPNLDTRLSCVREGVRYAGKGGEPAFSAVGERAGG